MQTNPENEELPLEHIERLQRAIGGMPVFDDRCELPPFLEQLKRDCNAIGVTIDISKGRMRAYCMRACWQTERQREGDLAGYTAVQWLSAEHDELERCASAVHKMLRERGKLPPVSP